MTALEFGEKNYKSNKLTIFLIGALVVSAIFSIISYNNLIGLRHDIKTVQNNLSKEQVANAELKNSYYQKIDELLTESSSQLSGLVKEKIPQYVSQEEDLSLSYKKGN